jgi:hypothetical protein
MLHGVASLLTSVALLAGSPSAWPRSPQGIFNPSCRVVGRVIDGKTRAGIGDARVRLDDGAAETTTAADGGFEFRDVRPGRHHVVAVLEGFAASAPATVLVEVGSDGRVEIEYSLGVTVEVRGTTPESSASPPKVSLGTVAMTGLQVASAVGGLDDVSRVTQLRPGVAPSQDDRNDLMVRGGGAFETAVRMDGFELPTGSHFAWPGSAGGGLSLIPSAVIERATIETSGFSVAFGERSSALLDIETRTGATGRVRSRADVSAGGVMALAEGPLPGGGGASGSWLASARRSIIEFAFSRADSRATPSYVETMGNLDVPISKVHRVHVLALGSSEGLEVNWTTASKKAVSDDQTLALGGLSLRSTWTPRTETYISVSWASNDVTLKEVEQTAASFSNHSLEHFLRGRAEIRQSLGSSVRLLAGMALKHSEVNFDLQDSGYRNSWNNTVPAVRASWHDGLTDVAAYADASWVFGPLQVRGGARADRSGVTSSWYASPRARLEYRPGARWRMMGSWGEYRQDIPNIWIGSNVANRNLDPVRCIQTTGGVEGEVWRGSLVTAEGFSKRYSGYPIDPSVPSRVLISAGADFESPLVGKLAPSGLVHADGVDLSLSQRLSRSMTLAAGYSYWDVREFNLDKKWIRADYDVRHQGRIWLVWHGARRWSASALWRYASGRPYTPYDVAASIKANNARFDQGRINAATYPPYHRLDVRADRVFVLKRAAITAFAEVDNVYDRDNIYMYDWSRTLKQSQPVYQWGLTPVAGVRIEF